MNLWIPTQRRKEFRSGGGGSTLTDGLVSFWPLTANGNASVSSNNLSSAGSPSFGTVAGEACVTTAPGNHLYNASPTGLGLDTFTLAAWVYRPSATTSNMLVLTCGSGTTPAAARYALRAEGDDARLWVSNGSTNVTLDIANVLTAATWKLMIGSYDSSTGSMTIYVDDGTSNNSGSSGYTTLNASEDGIGIGGDDDGSGTGNEFEGSIKCGGIWNRVLTAGERTELWNSGTPLVL